MLNPVEIPGKLLGFGENTNVEKRIVQDVHQSEQDSVDAVTPAKRYARIQDSTYKHPFRGNYVNLFV